MALTPENLKKIELEITSNCNAACPGCARTLNPDKLEINEFGLGDVKRIFDCASKIENKNFKLCGVLGDPIINQDCLEIVEYLLENGGLIEISTNGSLRSTEWWKQLGNLASYYKNCLKVHFCIDGHRETNHIYRIHTNFEKIEKNITTFCEFAPPYSSTWVFIVFDHNEKELEIAKKHAEKLNLKFATRTGMRNSYYNWVAKINKSSQLITVSSRYEHSKKESVDALVNFIDSKNKDKEKEKEIISSVTCKLIHQREVFIASDLSVWPCCFLWDSYFKNKEAIREKLSIFTPGWNNLRYSSLEQILSHEWFEKLLEESWQTSHPLHFDRCIKTCGYKQAYHNEIKYES
jgi:MoaA/NifB/PqqE/SkfB family radical SAM enzyme